jgi:hypothetical protein
VLAELSSYRLGEVVRSLASCLELLEQGECLAAKSRLDQRQLVQPAAAEDQVQAFDLRLDVPLAPTPHERGAQLRACQASALVGVGATARTARASEQVKPPDL